MALTRGFPSGAPGAATVGPWMNCACICGPARTSAPNCLSSRSMRTARVGTRRDRSSRKGSHRASSPAGSLLAGPAHRAMVHGGPRVSCIMPRGRRIAPKRRKCERDLYKNEFLKALRDAGQVVTLGGPEFAPEIVSHMDLHRAGRNEPSLKHVIEGLRAHFGQIRADIQTLAIHQE